MLLHTVKWRIKTNLRSSICRKRLQPHSDLSRTYSWYLCPRRGQENKLGFNDVGSGCYNPNFNLSVLWCVELNAANSMCTWQLTLNWNLLPNSNMSQLLSNWNQLACEIHYPANAFQLHFFCKATIGPRCPLAARSIPLIRPVPLQLVNVHLWLPPSGN